MSFENLLRERVVEKVEVSPEEIASLLDVAKRERAGVVSEKEALDVVEFSERYFDVVFDRLPRAVQVIARCD